MSGAEVWDAAERSVSGFWSLTRSQVYQELRRLVDSGFVDEPHTGRFKITGEGRGEVAAWFQHFALDEPRADQLRSAITLTVFFGHYLPGDLLARVVREHRLRVERRLDQLRRIEAALHDDRSLPGSTLRRGILNATVAIDWTDDVLGRLGRASGLRRRR